MSGYANINTFADPNVLLRTLSGQQTADVQGQQIANQTNQLLQPYKVQAAQQDVGNADAAYAAQASSALLQLPTEEARAAMYPQVVAEGQQRGFLKNAPSSYPGEAQLRRIQAMGLTLPQQYQYGVITAPGLQSQIDAILGNRTPTGTGGAGFSGGPLMGPDASDADKTTRLAQIAQRESGGNPTILNYVAQANPAAYGMGYTASGKYQIVNSTWADGKKLAGLDPSQYPTAASAPEAVQDKVARALFDRYGEKPWATSARGYPAAQPTAGTAAATTPAGPPGVQMGGAPPAPPGGPPGAAAGAYTGGGIGSALNPVAVKGSPIPAGKFASPVPSPVAAIQQGQQLAQATPVPPGTVQTAGPGAGTPPAAVASVEPPPQPGWGTTVGSYGAPSAAAPPAAPPPARPNQVLPGSPNGPAGAAPAPMQLPPSGVNSAQYQQAADLQRKALALDALVDPTGRAKLLAAGLRQQAQLLLQTDSVVQLGDGRQFHPLTGKIDLPGPPRFTEGEATWDGQKWTQTPPGQEGTPGKWAVGPGGQQFFPSPTRPAQGNYEAQRELFKTDIPEKQALNETNQSAANLQIRLGQMRQLVDQINTGAGGTERKDWANIAASLGLHDLEQQLIGKGGADAAQIFEKYSTQTAGELERATQGAKGSGIGALTLYKNANPGLGLQPNANKQMLNAQLLAAQANRDYSEGALQHINQNTAAFAHGEEYVPKSTFDEQWAAARNPQIYTAALRALDGDSWERWTAGLNLKTGEDVQRVRAILERADPTTKIVWKNGTSVPVSGAQ